MLKDYCERVHPEAKPTSRHVLSNAALTSAPMAGATALVTPQNWLFLGTYKKLREQSLEECELGISSRDLGRRLSRQSAGEVVNVALVVITRRHAQSARHSLLGLMSPTMQRLSEKLTRCIRASRFSCSKSINCSNPDAECNSDCRQDRLQLLARICRCAVTGWRHWRFVTLIDAFGRLPQLANDWMLSAEHCSKTHDYSADASRFLLGKMDKARLQAEQRAMLRRPGNVA